ncbi:carboxyltransferase subunit alpha [Pseudobutyrivibrio xylanivorans]|uniref:acetyl-CoA carboxytransferase n=1 Tax=Pseudobutyrivibrio xylanivorans DSM 14809 TaxID=1123012 RepID=A0A1M6GKM3_PSEXY|nr:carboxyltransferase subunit alpha [Pseudobutyrivibrio xylanivorans]SHJ10463.1 acetyl-CoA carboxylase carboxyl transferase subunit alpha [Pseudobutyrivibrio xylanivorans DSM 14809]
MKAIDRVLAAREKDRPKITDYMDNVFTDFFEQKGDMLGKEDASIYGGIALFQGRPVTVIGHRKGNDVNENITCNFGMPGPEGYRKALRLMKQAEKFNRPIISFVDTPGAYPGLEAEAYGISQAISGNLAAMSSLKVPVITIVTGEGSSGGALGLAVANRVYMLENAVYSVLSPEGFASILWSDSSRRDEAAEAMKLTAQDLFDFGVIDGIIPERGLYIRVSNVIASALKELDEMSGEELAQERFEKFRSFDEGFLQTGTSARMENV